MLSQAASFKLLDTAFIQAQKLPTVITTASKLQGSDHRLYIMRDPDAPPGCVHAMAQCGLNVIDLNDLSPIMTPC